MLTELVVVLRDDNCKPLLWIFNLNQLKDLEVVVVDLTRQWEGAYVDDVDIRVLDGEESGDLPVFFLFVLFDSHPLDLLNGKRVDMYFNPSAFLDVWPILSEVSLHLVPVSVPC
jgi:hypothetical protein